MSESGTESAKDELSARRSERIHLRLTPEQKERYRYAAALEGLTLSQFIVNAAVHRAREVLKNA